MQAGNALEGQQGRRRLSVMEVEGTSESADDVGRNNFRLNCLELILGVISVGVVPLWYSFLQLGTLFSVVYGLQAVFVLVSVLIVVGHLSNASMHTNLLLTLSIVGCVTWLVTGLLVGVLFLLTAVFTPFNAFLLSSIAAINNAAVHLLDAVKRRRAKRDRGVVYDRTCQEVCLLPKDVS